MPIETLSIKECFVNPEEGERVVPSFHFLNLEDDSPFRFMRLQCKEELRANPYTGVQHTSDYHINKCRESLRLARMERADLFLTPEYCVPLSLIDEVIQNSELQPRPNTLWCLGCEGVSTDDFSEYLTKWGDQAIVGKRSLEEIIENHFVNFILYIFKSKENDKLCLVPQLKLQRMGEPIIVCEGSGLSIGRKVIVFGEESENQLFSLICADAFLPEIKSGQLFFQNREPKRYIILHPQLNPSPRNSDIAALRNSIFGNKSGRDLIYITANWAEGTTISSEGNTPITIETPWTSIYRRFISLDGERDWNETLREIRINNYKHGLGLGFNRTKKYKLWFANKIEHIQQINLFKPFDGGAEITNPLGKVQVEKAYIPNDEQNGWQERNIPFNSDLPLVLSEAAKEEFSYPRSASVEDRDKFFGYCLGHLEKGQLYITDKESNGRISYHIDKHCETEREQGAELIAKLISCLKSKEEFPGQLKRLGENFRFQLAQRGPFNLIPSRGNESEGALAIYADRQNTMKEKVEQFNKSMPGIGWFMDDRICVFSHDISGKLIHYPKYSDEFTSPMKTYHSTDYTEGGVSIESEMD